VFDTVGNEQGRQAHLAGQIAAALGEAAQTTLSVPPMIAPVDLFGSQDLLNGVAGSQPGESQLGGWGAGSHRVGQAGFVSSVAAAFRLDRLRSSEELPPWAPAGEVVNADRWLSVLTFGRSSMKSSRLTRRYCGCIS
jgi:hypothetical protein